MKRPLLDSLFLIAIVSGVMSLAPASAEPPVKVRFVTDWKAQAPLGGFYQAQARGFYREAGLEVQLIQGGPTVNVPLLLGANQVDLGVGSNSFIPLNMVQAGIPATAVAAIFQKDPQVLISHPRDDIRSIADMRGKPIMISDAGVGSHWIWLKSKFGFSDRQIRKYTYNLAPFLADPKAIQQGYVTSEPYQIEQASGVAPQVFLLADEDYPAYATLILASNRLIARDPETVRAFVAASIAGWRDYLTGDPAPGNALILADNPEMTEEVLRHAIGEIDRYSLAMGGDAATGGIGIMTEARWRAFFEIMSDAGLYPRDLDWRAAFDLGFLPAPP